MHILNSRARAGVNPEPGTDQFRSKLDIPAISSIRVIIFSRQSSILEPFFHPWFVGEYFLAGEAVEFVRKNQPLIGFVNKIIRNNAGYISFRLKPGRCDSDVIRQISAHFYF